MTMRENHFLYRDLLRNLYENNRIHPYFDLGQGRIWYHYQLLIEMRLITKSGELTKEGEKVVPFIVDPESWDELFEDVISYVPQFSKIPFSYAVEKLKMIKGLDVEK